MPIQTLISLLSLMLAMKPFLVSHIVGVPSLILSLVPLEQSLPLPPIPTPIFGVSITRVAKSFVSTAMVSTLLSKTMIPLRLSVLLEALPLPPTSSMETLLNVRQNKSISEPLLHSNSSLESFLMMELNHPIGVKLFLPLKSSTLRPVLIQSRPPLDAHPEATVSPSPERDSTPISTPLSASLDSIQTVRLQQSILEEHKSFATLQAIVLNSILMSHCMSKSIHPLEQRETITFSVLLPIIMVLFAQTFNPRAHPLEVFECRPHRSRLYGLHFLQLYALQGLHLQRVSRHL